MSHKRTLLAFLTAVLLCSCATYVTPGRQANLSTFTDPRVKKAFEARPAIRFPATLALIHVQEGGYPIGIDAGGWFGRLQRGYLPRRRDREGH